jgi:tetratricopeptide (TPR) repeat protein
MERWEEALGAYERATTAAVFTEVGRSSSYYHIGVLCEQRLGPPQVERALSAFEAALAVDDFSSDEEAADCHYRRGAILWREGRDPQECIAEFQRAVELNHRHVQAHILLGVAYYAQYGDAVVAEAEIREALELSPREKWAYVRLGDIHRQEGRIGEAAAAYERALEIDPNFEAAQRRLQALNENE